MAIESRLTGSGVIYVDTETGRRVTKEYVQAGIEKYHRENPDGSLMGRFFNKNNWSAYDTNGEYKPTGYEQTGAIDNAINGNGRGADISKVYDLHNANAYQETDSDRAARLREASNILGFDNGKENMLMQTGMSNDDIMKSALALAKKKQEEPDDWEQFAADHPATVKYLEQQKNMAISYDDIKPLGRIEETANTVKKHLEMMELEEKIADLGRKYDSQNMSYNDLSADQRVELNDLLNRRKEIAGSIDTWSVGNVLGGLLVLKEDLPMALGIGLQTGLVGAGVGALGGGVGAIPGAITGFGAGFRIGMGASMGYRMAGTQYAENMMRADANGQYMDAHSLKQGAWGAGLGMMALGTFGVGRLTSKIPTGAIAEKFFRTTSPSVLNNPAAREAAWKGYLSTLGVGIKEAAVQDVIFGGGTAALTFGANRYSEALSGLDYSNREDGTLMQNIINGMEQFAPMALGTGVGFSVAGKMASGALGKKPASPPMPVADGLNKVMSAMDESKTASRSKQATRDMVDGVFGETASAQDVQINARGLVRLLQEADPENPDKVTEVVKRLGVDEKELNEAVELGGDIRVPVRDFVTEFGDKENQNLRAEVLKEVRDVDGATENERGEILTQEQQAFQQTIDFLKESQKLKPDENDPLWVAAVEKVKEAYPKYKPKDTEDLAKPIYKMFKQAEANGTLKLVGFDTAEQALRAVEVRRKDAPTENNNIELNQTRENNIDNLGDLGDNIGKELTDKQKTDLFDKVNEQFVKQIEKVRNTFATEEDFLKELRAENSTIRENIFKTMHGTFTELNAKNLDLAAKKEKVKRIRGKIDDLSDKQIEQKFEEYREGIGRLIDYGGRIYQELSYNDGNINGRADGLRVWGDVERQRNDRIARARAEREQQIKQEHSDNQGAFRLQQTDERAASDVANTTIQELFQKAWVGSPADFNKFDLGYVGTGEGAQVHGYGLYSAADRKVAQRYKEVLSAGKSDIQIMVGDRRLPAFGFVDGLTEAETKAYKAIQSVGYDKDKAITLLRDIGEKEAADILVDKFEVNYKENKGKLYEVEIPDNDVLLDEQKPFSEQPEKVQNALRKLISESETAKKHPAFAEEIYEANGKKIYGIVTGLAEGDAPRNANFNNTQRLGSELLNKYGIKGITYEGGMDGRCYVVFDDKAIEIINKYNQEANKQGNVLASYMPQEQGHAIIELYKNANPSSLAHEMLHHWVFLNENAYRTGMMEGQALKDFETLAKFAGHELGTEWSREEHEKLASAWETYLSEGKAPSLDLVSTFDRFKKWMKKIYQTLTRHAIPINDDVRAVFDRMLASDREIELAEAFYQSEPLFAGREMNASALREYAGIVLAAHEKAQKEMDKRVMAEVNPAMKEIRDNVAANLREDIAGEMMLEPVYAARGLFTAPLESADFKANKEAAIKAKIEERLDLLVKQSALGVEKRGEVVSEHGTVKENWFVGDSNNYDWYKEMFNRRGGKIPASWYRFINAYKAGEKTLKQMPKTMREEYERIAEEQLTKGHRESVLGDIPEDIEFVNLKEGTPAMSWIVANGGGIRLDRSSIYERYGKGALPEKWLTDKDGFTIDEVADYLYDGKAGGDRLFEELTTKPTFSKELANRVRAKMTEFKEQEYGSLRESAIKAVHNEKSLEAAAVDLEMFNMMAAELKAKNEQKTADAIADGRIKAKGERKVEEEKQKGQERLEAQKAKDAEKLDNAVDKAKEKGRVEGAREQHKIDVAVMRGQIRTKAAREMAKEQIANTKVGEILSWQKYAALGKRASDEAVRALARGDYEGAVEAKNREITCRAMAEAAAKADTEVKKTMRYFDRINKRGNNMKGVPHEFNVQIDNLLAKYNLLNREPLKPLEGDAPQLSQFIKDCEENYFVPLVPESIVNGDAMHYSWLTLKDLRDLKDGVKSLQHTGKQLDALIANEKKQSLKEVCQALVEQLSTHQKRYALQGEMGQADVPSTGLTSLVKTETLLRLMDKGEENGVFVRSIYNPIKLGLDDYANRSRKIISDWDKLMADTGWTKKELYNQKNIEHDFDFLPNPKQSHQTVILAALNWGNEGNRDRLRYYFMSPEQRRMKSFTPEQLAEIDGKVMKMFEVLTEKDLKLIQGVWDMLETYSPEIRKHEVEVAGVDVKMVEPTAFTVMSADGKMVQMKGGYFPIRYDGGKSTRALDLDKANELYKQNSAVAASTSHGHVKARTNHMNRPLLLEWNTLLDHLRNVNYDLAMRKPIMDVSRILRNEDVQSAIAETFGNEKVSMLQDWVKDIATDQREGKLTFAENAMRFMRTRMAVAYLGFRTKALTIDLPQNLITSVWQNGLDDTIKGISQFYLTGDYRQKLDFINARSPMMRDKISFMDANLADLRVSMLDQSKMAQWNRGIQKFAFTCDLFADMAVNAPMWLRFHAEAMKRGMTDAEASLEADAKVRRASVDTSKAGMAAIQRGSEFKKLVTPFYSYFNAFFNRLYFDYGMARIKWADGQQMDAAGLMVRTAVLGVGIPTMIEAIMQGVVLNNDKEKDKKKRQENMIKEAASSSFSYLANTVPLAGAAATFGFNKAIGKKYANYELSPVESVVEATFGVPAAVVDYVMKKDTDKEAGRKLRDSVARAASLTAPYPNMMNTLAFNIWDVISKGDFSLADLVTRRRNQK